jgi:hypothetical protein
MHGPRRSFRALLAALAVLATIGGGAGCGEEAAVKKAAEEAKTAAEGAENTAEEAKSAAEDAKTAAEEAKSAAEDH